MQGQSITACYHSLIAAVIERAIADLKGSGPRCRKIETDRAMVFVLSDDCEAWCLELGIDCEVIREKAAALYRKIIRKEAPETGRKKRLGRPLKVIKHGNTRQSPGSPVSLPAGTFKSILEKGRKA
jgi:plasmid stabilization system protein ParE